MNNLKRSTLGAYILASGLSACTPGKNFQLPTAEEAAQIHSIVQQADDAHEFINFLIDEADPDVLFPVYGADTPEQLQNNVDQTYNALHAYEDDGRIYTYSGADMASEDDQHSEELHQQLLGQSIIAFNRDNQDDWGLDGALHESGHDLAGHSPEVKQRLRETNYEFDYTDEQVEFLLDQKDYTYELSILAKPAAYITKQTQLDLDFVVGGAMDSVDSGSRTPRQGIEYLQSQLQDEATWSEAQARLTGSGYVNDVLHIDQETLARGFATYYYDAYQEGFTEAIQELEDREAESVELRRHQSDEVRKTSPVRKRPW